MKHQTIYNRLRRIEGQIRGVEEMVGKDRPEEEILVQLEAIRSSVSSTISTLIEGMLVRDESGKAILEDKQIRALLRSVKKN